VNTQMQQTFRFLPRAVVGPTLRLFDRISTPFVRLKVSPNLISVVGLLAGMGVGLLFALEKPIGAAFLAIFCGLLDILDGKVAIHADKKSLYGAIFDSSLDRYSEFFMYLGLAYHFRTHWALWLVFFTLLGSTMVSYTRARAEGLGIDAKVGMMQRAERLIFFIMGAFIGIILHRFDQTMIVVLGLIALFSHITTFQRIVFVKKMESRKKLLKED